MKAICVKEPWYSEILKGKKMIETRTWTTKYRGDILFVCSKNPVSVYSGAAWFIAELYDIKPMTKDHEWLARCEIYDRAYSWFLRRVRPIKPINVRGRLMLFEIENNLIEEILK